MSSSTVEPSPLRLRSESRTAHAQLIFNPFDPKINVDPYPHYERLRRQDPIHWSRLGMWFVGSYEDVRSLLKDRRLRVRDIPKLLQGRSELVGTTQVSSTQPHSLEHFANATCSWLAFQEGADHKRLRGIYSAALARSVFEKLRPMVREECRLLIERHRDRGEMDVVKDFARHIPIRFIARILGLPLSTLPQIESWARNLTRFIVSYTSLEDLGEMNDVAAHFTRQLQSLIAEKRRCPVDDVISRWSATTSDQSVTIQHEQDLISICVFMVVAGLEAVENLIANSTLALLRHPEKHALLRENLRILPSAVEELARFDTPLQIIMRNALEDVQVGNKMIRAGDSVYLVLGSANRDPERFERPDDLLLERPQNHHLSFGDGHHICVGAQLSRMEAQEALGALLECSPNMALATDDLRWGRNLLSRGLISLPIRIGS